MEDDVQPQTNNTVRPCSPQLISGIFEGMDIIDKTIWHGEIQTPLCSRERDRAPVGRPVRRTPTVAKMAWAAILFAGASAIPAAGNAEVPAPTTEPRLSESASDTAGASAGEPETAAALSRLGAWYTGSVLMGNGATATGEYAVAVGERASAAAASVAIGAGAQASHENSIALGSGSLTTFGAQSGYIAYGLAPPQFSVGEVNVGNRTISGVAAGSADQDAVNVAQLRAVSEKAGSVEGAVAYDTSASGAVNRNSLTLSGETANGGTLVRNVADGVDAHDAVNLGQLNAAVGTAIGNAAAGAPSAFYSVNGDGATEAAQSAGAHSTAIGPSARADADNAVALGAGAIADRANTVSVGSEGQERQVTHVAAGVQGTDAVNLNQLTQSMKGAVSDANSYTDDQVRSARRDAYGGTASALAMAGLPQAVLPGHGMVAAAAGTYGGQSAIALGVSQLSATGKWAYKVQGTSSSRGAFGASVGAGMHW